jgi:lipoprotein-anchoring transpeptidase ErfK/SrfK
MSTIIRRLIALVAVTTLAIVVASALLGRSGDASAGAGHGQTDQVPVAANPHASTVATATVASLAVFTNPTDASASRRLANPRPSGAPLVLLVVGDRAGRAGWLNVQLPERPNGSTGWVRRTDVTTEEHQFRIEVSLGGHRLSAFDGDRTILETEAAVGQPGTPTPTGDFYTTKLLRPTNPGGAYGPYAFGLSAHSDVLTDFAGGDGTVGIHGTNNPASLGTDASHGCIRISDEAITTLAESLPVGTPVRIAP